MNKPCGSIRTTPTPGLNWPRRKRMRIVPLMPLPPLKRQSTSDDPEIGHLWMLACEAFDNDPEELQELSRLVFGEMLDQFPRLENIIDSRKVRAIELLRAIGFAVEPALPSADADLRLVWIDSDRLHCGGRAGLLPN